MTIPRIAGLLFAFAVAPGAQALQLGQLSEQSHRGEPLHARVALYGALGADANAVQVTVLPEFGASSETLLARGVRAALSLDASGAPFVELSSARAMQDVALPFRLQVERPGVSLIQHYVLHLPEPPAARALAVRERPRPRPRRPAASPEAVSRPSGADYGPVRPGQSLWQILNERGLAGGDLAATLRAVVAMNPAAFVGGDANRLRVGAVLHLPGQAPGAQAAEPAPPAVEDPPSVARDEGIDAETAARLARLAERYAEIRARYAAQHAAHAPVSDTPDAAAAKDATTAVANAPATPVAAKAEAAAPVARQEPAPHVATPRPQAPALPLPAAAGEATPLWMSPFALGVAIVLALGILTIGVRQLLTRLRGARLHQGAKQADRDKLAEIALKSGKRVQLEDELRRMMSGRRGETPATPALSPADLLRGARGSMDEIEACITHGRYDEAEALLQQVIAAAPDDFRAKLRLAEIYYLNERTDEFADLANEIHQQHRREIGDESWQRLMRMGKVIAPERPPFSGPVPVEAARRAR